jgi:hypothetical protein
VLHVAYQTFPDSKAATGNDDSGGGAAPSLSQLARNLTKLLPGVHW